MALPEHRQPWQVLDRKLIADASPWIRLYREKVLTARGQVVDDYHLAEMPDFSCAIPILPNGNFLFLESYRHGVGEVSLSLPGGIVDEGETPEEAIKRELKEEIGMKATKWTPLGSYIVSLVRGCGNGSFFLAEHLSSGHERLPDGDLESSVIREFSIEEVEECLGENRFKSLGVVTGVLLALNLLKSRGH